MRRIFIAHSLAFVSKQVPTHKGQPRDVVAIRLLVCISVVVVAPAGSGRTAGTKRDAKYCGVAAYQIKSCMCTSVRLGACRLRFHRGRNVQWEVLWCGCGVQAVCSAADELRRRVCGDEVSYTVNRNINYSEMSLPFLLRAAANYSDTSLPFLSWAATN